MCFWIEFRYDSTIYITFFQKTLICSQIRKKLRKIYILPHFAPLFDQNDIVLILFSYRCLWWIGWTVLRMYRSFVWCLWAFLGLVGRFPLVWCQVVRFLGESARKGLFFGFFYHPLSENELTRHRISLSGVCGFLSRRASTHSFSVAPLLESSSKMRNRFPLKRD